jgi:cell division protein FtsW (lipid II flippase)
MSRELSEIRSDSEAVKFAAGCMWAAFAIAEQAEHDSAPHKGTHVHKDRNAFMRNPRRIGLACGLTAATLGLAYLVIAGAPITYVIGNVCATVLGVGSFVVANRTAKQPVRMSSGIWLGVGALLIGTSMFGVPVDGARRWIRLGSMMVQPSLIVVPGMLVAYSLRRGVISTVAIILAALALALQPDRAMAAVLASGTTLLAVKARGRLTSAAALSGLASLGVTLYRADTLPAVPYVDRILLTAFDLNLAIGCAVILGAALLVLPAVFARSSSRDDARAYAVFGVVWLAIIAAAAIGNYPTPIVGYGGSAIVGYFISIAFLPQRSASVAVAESTDISIRDNQDVTIEKNRLSDFFGDGDPGVVRNSHSILRAEPTLAAAGGA